MKTVCAAAIVAAITAACTTPGLATNPTSAPLASTDQAESASQKRGPSAVEHSIPSIEPIYGYGDFSNTPYHDIDWVVVTALVVQCANDHGIAARVLPPGDGYTLSAVSESQQGFAIAYVSACRAGLNVPQSEPLSEEMLESLYSNLLDTKVCLENLGYSVSEPPSLGQFIESYPRGEAWSLASIPNSLPGILIWRSRTLINPNGRGSNELCPQP